MAATQLYGQLLIGTIDGTNAIFNLEMNPISGTVQLYRNGMRQEAGSDYSISGQTITFIATPPQVGDLLLADYSV